jgi:hypothetical protein
MEGYPDEDQAVMNKFVCMRKIWVSASMVLCIMLAGCITVRDLDRIADAHRMQIDIKKSTRKTLDTPFQREKLVGKWVGEYQVQEFIWCQDQSYKKFPVSKWRMEYEFQQDGKYITTSYLNGSFKGRSEGTWIYCVNINGVAEITFQGQGVERPYWSVFWYGEDELALAHRNANMAGKIHVDGFKNTYDATWATDWLYKRDIYLNEKFVTHHIKGNVGHRREHHVQPRILKRVKESAKEDLEKSSDQDNAQSRNGASEPIYNILSCEREAGNDFAYSFTLELVGKDKSLRTFRHVQKEFRQAIKDDYVESFSGVNKNSLYVEFPEFKLNNGKIVGRAVVLTISVASLAYDPNTRTGKLAVKVNANQYEEARKWVRRNIETLARDKNIALVTGETPPAAKFYLGREELKDGNILEVEFRTE